MPARVCRELSNLLERATPRGRAGAAVWLTRRIGGRESRGRDCRERSVEEVCNRATQSRLTTLYPPLIHRRDRGGEVYAFRLLPATVKTCGRNPYPHVRLWIGEAHTHGRTRYSAPRTDPDGASTGLDGRFQFATIEVKPVPGSIIGPER